MANALYGSSASIIGGPCIGFFTTVLAIYLLIKGTRRKSTNVMKVNEMNLSKQVDSDNFGQKNETYEHSE